MLTAQNNNLPLQTFSFPWLSKLLTLKSNKWITSYQNVVSDRRIDRFLIAFLSCKNSTLTPVSRLGCPAISFYGFFVPRVKGHFALQQKYVWIRLSFCTTRDFLFLERNDSERNYDKPVSSCIWWGATTGNASITQAKSQRKLHVKVGIWTSKSVISYSERFVCSSI